MKEERFDQPLVQEIVEQTQKQQHKLSVVEMERFAEIFSKSGLFPDIKSQYQAFVQIQAGQELGIGPYASMRGMVCYNNQPPEPNSALIAALIKRSGRYTYRIKRLDYEGCTIEWFEKEYQQWRSLGTSSFTKKDAEATLIWEDKQKKPLAQKWNYQSWGEDMYFARAITKGARRFCPEITFGWGIDTAIQSSIAQIVEEEQRSKEEQVEQEEQGGEEEQEPNEQSDREWDPHKAIVACAERARVLGIRATEWQTYAYAKFGITSRKDMNRSQAIQLYRTLQQHYDDVNEWIHRHRVLCRLVKYGDKIGGEFQNRVRQFVASYQQLSSMERKEQAKALLSECEDYMKDPALEFWQDLEPNINAGDLTEEEAKALVEAASEQKTDRLIEAVVDYALPQGRTE